MVSVAFTGGGTGGHIYPGLAVVSYLKKILPCRVFWIGSGQGMDRAVVEAAGIEFFGIPSGKLRRYFSLRNVSDVFKTGAGFFAARRILKRERPALLFSKGGFVSVPPCAAAKSLNIPVFTHESDYSPGLATRINARFAERVFIPYKESARFFGGPASGKLRVSGNPIRPEFAAADAAKGRAFLGLEEGERMLLVLGGSLGSRGLNELVAGCLPELTRYYTVVHQTGESNDREAPARAARYLPYAYFRDEMPHVIAAAEIVLCRSGANTIWECKYLKKPMIFVPLPSSGTSRGDQMENARLFEEAGAAIYLEEDKSAPEKLPRYVASLADDPEKRVSMGEAAVTGSNAAELIAEEIVRRIEREV